MHGKVTRQSARFRCGRIDDDDMPLTHEQAVVEADAELRRMTYHPVRKAVGIVVAMGVAIGASLGVGYMFGGDPGGIVTAITGVVCPQDAKYALDGRRAVCQHVRHLGASRKGPGSARRTRGSTIWKPSSRRSSRCATR